MQVLPIVSAVIFVYALLLSLRIVLGWFTPREMGRPWDFLRRITDPYLDLFRRIRFLRAGMFDFSPVAAVLALVLVIGLINQLANSPRFTVGFVIASVVGAAWSGVQFLLIFFLAIAVLRAIPLLFRAVAGSPIWRVVDLIIDPLVSWMARLFRLGARTVYAQHLLLTIGVLFVSLLLGGYIVKQIVYGLSLLPF